jgi:hypothetical protein
MFLSSASSLLLLLLIVVVLMMLVLRREGHHGRNIVPDWAEQGERQRIARLGGDEGALWVG